MSNCLFSLGRQNAYSILFLTKVIMILIRIYMKFATAKTSKDLINPVSLFQKQEDIIIWGARHTVKNISANSGSPPHSCKCKFQYRVRKYVVVKRSFPGE